MIFFSVFRYLDNQKETASVSVEHVVMMSFTVGICSTRVLMLMMCLSP